MARIAQLVVGGQPTSWTSIGLTFRDGLCSLGDLVVRLDPSLPPGLASWQLTDCIDDGDIDGIPTSYGAHSPAQAMGIDSSVIDIVGIDHVVVLTNDLERTSKDLTRVTGEPLKRIRDAGNGVRQGFHRLGSVIVEIVERSDVERTSLWGFVMIARNIDDVAAHMGPDVIGSPRGAVQQGRRIASFRSGVGLGVAVALITPETTRQ